MKPAWDVKCPLFLHCHLFYIYVFSFFFLFSSSFSILLVRWIQPTSSLRLLPLVSMNCLNGEIKHTVLIITRERCDTILYWVLFFVNWWVSACVYRTYFLVISFKNGWDNDEQKQKGTHNGNEETDVLLMVPSNTDEAYSNNTNRITLGSLSFHAILVLIFFFGSVCGVDNNIGWSLTW